MRGATSLLALALALAARAQEPAEDARDVHYLFCETRPLEKVWTYEVLEANYGPDVDFLARAASGGGSATRAAGPSQLYLHNVCLGLNVTGHQTHFARHTRLQQYLTALPPADVVLWTDSDVATQDLSAAELLKRFDEVRGLKRVVFGGEPFCWAPWGSKRAHYFAHGCSPRTRELYATLFARNMATSWRCARFLSAGGFVGFAADVVRMEEKLIEVHAANHKHPANPERPCYFERARKPNGEIIPEYKLSDQCLWTNVVLQSASWVEVDVHERIFAPAAHALNRADKGARSPAVPCGNMSCSYATTPDWHPMRNGTSTILARGPLHQQQCAGPRGPTAPMLIHFASGVGKALIKAWPWTLPPGYKPRGKPDAPTKYPLGMPPPAEKSRPPAKR